MGGKRVAGLLLRSESVPEICRGRYAKRQAPMVQSNRHSPVAPQHRSPIYSPPALTPTSRSNPTIFQSNDEFEALVEEIVEHQPSSSPDPLSTELIFEPWPRVQMVSPCQLFGSVLVTCFLNDINCRYRIRRPQ